MKWRLLCCLLLSVKSLLAQHPALIPSPEKVSWTAQGFMLKHSTDILTDPRFEKEATQLRDWLLQKGKACQVKTANAAAHHICLIYKAGLKEEEAYELRVTNDVIEIAASSGHGIFNGIQTLYQLLQGDTFAGCNITDKPAFSWRGYLVDVGRNYQSMALLKQQIDKMAAYKLNVFQFHFTENIAWRWPVPGYPGLTADSNMLRNPGKVYTDVDIHELMRYCADRHILFVPEIDMPGHSDAFKRAMGVDMQSDSGMHILQNIVQHFIKTFHPAYLHIGGDEVHITNKTFLPAMVNMVEATGVRTLGWDPGGNIPDKTIHQLWMRDAGTKPGVKYLDSRHLYLNHMDPLESVTTIFQRRIGDKVRGDSSMLGGVICLWNDRKVADEKDLIRMNPVYPAMLAFAERSWAGGGEMGWRSNIDPADTAMRSQFRNFEVRLWQHRQLYFAGLPFQYTPQSNLQWTLTGRNQTGRIVKTAPAIGGTIVLRHFWHPLVKGVIGDNKDSLRWQATATFQSERDTILPVWISFYNLSRSTNSNTPAAGTWDNRGSSIQVNGETIAPPKWTFAGRKPTSEEPLVDEGYDYRAPSMVHFKKGKNIVTADLPVNGFQSADWQNPVKWMFTFAPVQAEKVQLSPFFTDHMVLQRDQPISVFGKAPAGKGLRVSLGNKTVHTTAGADGKWKAILPPMKADTVPQTLTVRTNEDIISCYDVLIGDVWVCAGQSNMEFSLWGDMHAAEAYATAQRPHLRLLQEHKQTTTYSPAYSAADTIYLHPENYFSGNWQRSDSNSARMFSAVGYYFGARIQQETGVPVGLINVAVGGSPTEAWIRPDAARNVPAVAALFQGDWLQNAAMEPWCIERGHDNLDPLLKQGIQPPANELGYRHPFQPGFLYDAAIARLSQMSVKGIIWYQGESNALSKRRMEQHEQLFPLLVADWRKQWHSGELPFYFCQISSISTDKGYKSEYWPAFRDGQRRMADSIPFSGMAVSSDIGHPTDVHPRDKRTVGERLARVALHKTYQLPVVYKGPVPVKSFLQGDTAIIQYDPKEQIATAGNKPLHGFSLEDGKEISAVMEANLIKVRVPAGTRFVYYGWQPYSLGNLVNGAGLPASSMRIAL